MSWDEKLFDQIYQLWKKRRKSDQNNLAQCELEPLTRRLEILLSALSETTIEVRSTENPGGLIGNVLFLPKKCNLYSSQETNLQFYIYRILFIATYLTYFKDSIFSPILIDKKMLDDFPSFSKTSAILKADLAVDKYIWLYGDPPQFLDKTTANTFSNLTLQTDVANDLSPQEFEGKTKNFAKIHTIKEEQESPLVHVFEKVNTVEEFKGGNKQVEDSNSLSDEQNALNEVELEYVLRTNSTSKSVYKSNALVETIEIEDSVEENTDSQNIFQYPEWFTAEKKYRNNWCTVYESIPEKTQSTEIDQSYQNHKLVKDLKRKLEKLYNQSSWTKANLDGDELDLSALIDRQVDLKLKHETSDKIFLRKENKLADFATLILLDTSLSTDSYIRGQRIHDTLTHALKMFGHSLHSTKTPLGIFAFYSNTRKKCHFQNIKDFHEPWTDFDNRISSIKPTGYTRIGPALRHATYKLQQIQARKKVIILLSDAKPSDYDSYEGVHGIHDVFHAVLDAKALNIHFKTFSLSEKIFPYHVKMFGKGNYYLLKNEQEMTTQLFEIYSQIMKTK